MKRIVNGMTYNTDTALKFAKAEWSKDGTENTGIFYKTRGGAFFMHQETTRQVWNERERGYRTKVEHSFEPLSPETAQAWLNHGEGDIEILVDVFECPPEATAEEETSATIYTRVPMELKKLLDERAAAQGLSGNAFVMRCLENCLK